MTRTNDGFLFIFSGALSFAFSFLLFFAFLSFIILKENLIRLDYKKSSEIAINLEIPEFAYDPQKDESSQHQKYGASSVADLFGKVETTQIDKVLENRRVEESKPTFESKTIGDSVYRLRTNETTQQALNIPNISTSTTSDKNENSASDQQLEDLYLSKIYKLLSDGWHPGIGDLGKIAIIRFTIGRDGSVDYRLISSSGDQLFQDRLRTLLERIKANGVDKPDRRLVLELKFVVKE